MASLTEKVLLTQGTYGADWLIKLECQTLVPINDWRAETDKEIKERLIWIKAEVNRVLDAEIKRCEEVLNHVRKTKGCD